MSISSDLIMKEEDVRSHLASGAYIARRPVDRKSECFIVIQMIYERNGSIINNWYACSRCPKLFQTNPSSGTDLLLRHAAIHEPSLGEKIKSVRKVNKKTISKIDQPIVVAIANTERDSEVVETVSDRHHETVSPASNADSKGLIAEPKKNCYVIDADKLSEAFEIAAKIGNLVVGPISSNDFKKHLPVPDQTWYEISMQIIVIF